MYFLPLASSTKIWSPTTTLSMSQKARKLGVFGYPRRCPAMYTLASSCHGKPVPSRWMPAKSLSASSSSPNVFGMGEFFTRSILGTVSVRVSSDGAFARSSAVCFCSEEGASGATASSGAPIRPSRYRRPEPPPPPGLLPPTGASKCARSPPPLLCLPGPATAERIVRRFSCSILYQSLIAFRQSEVGFSTNRRTRGVQIGQILQRVNPSAIKVVQGVLVHGSGGLFRAPTGSKKHLTRLPQPADEILDGVEILGRAGVGSRVNGDEVEVSQHLHQFPDLEPHRPPSFAGDPGPPVHVEPFGLQDALEDADHFALSGAVGEVAGYAALHASQQHVPLPLPRMVEHLNSLRHDNPSIAAPETFRGGSVKELFQRFVAQVVGLGHGLRDEGTPHGREAFGENRIFLGCTLHALVGYLDEVRQRHAG